MRKVIYGKTVQERECNILMCISVDFTASMYILGKIGEIHIQTNG